MARYYKRKRIGANVYTQGKFGKGLREIVDTDNPLLYSDGRYPTKLTAADLPEDYIKIHSRVIRYMKGYLTFVCLGDVGDASFVKKIRARKKILLLGNHDKKKDYKGLFDEIYDGPLLIAEKILLSHKPVYGLPWCLNIHGHDHSNIESYKEGCKHLNLAANVCGYTPVSLGKLIKGGILSDITSIHRITIDRATEKKEKWHGEAVSDN